jgi:hypothetical protein
MSHKFASLVFSLLHIELYFSTQVKNIVILKKIILEGEEYFCPVQALSV